MDLYLTPQNKQMSKSKHMQSNQANNASHTIYKQEAQSNRWALVKRGHINLDKLAKLYQVICELLSTNIES